MIRALLLTAGEVLSPEPIGVHSILVIDQKIVKVFTDTDSAKHEMEALDRLAIPCDVISAEGCTIIPGLIDTHEHLIGGSGERGFNTATPEISLVELTRAGITTVVGCLGTDQVTRNLRALLARVKSLNDDGITAYLWTGGYDVPPGTLTGSVKTDMIFVKEVIGVGEIAISDVRGSQPTLAEIARVVSNAYVGGILTQKSGVTHFHVGPGIDGMKPLIRLLDEFELKPMSIYPTHAQRNDFALEHGVELTQRGVMIDFDTEEEALSTDIDRFRRLGGKLEMLTLSSDASFSSPCTLFNQVAIAAKDLKMPLAELIPLVTLNPAKILRMSNKGRIAPGMDADLVVLSSDLRIRDVVACGSIMIRNHEPVRFPRALENSNRRIELYGQKKGKADR